ncbi:putative membrane protein (TIGR00267 family) [Mucilaginibacter gracilis]|uniref:Putative membrane protein (TIGR00267 family) n=1 Tax=Mucilaginibacter gracilis TaxID=423350 RepID=A0A495J732_9SPHI|nr:VIT1/CCC1 transporter family protein [Mucilaginibacter gracilis]RKR84553.1 putative membrane protein (TIGR00267 family) [Mucilaginibacter gracilis]
MHNEQHVTSSETIRDIVIGMSDGLTVPFALAAGLSGAISSSGIVVTAGIAEIVAGSIAMGLGGFLAGRTEVDHYQSELKREYDEVERVPEQEKIEVMEVFADFGLSAPLQQQIADEMSKDKKKWVDFMMRYELGLEEPHANRATKSAITIGLSYIIGGIIPLSPYLIESNSQIALYYSCGITLICLFIFGYFKSKMTGQPAFSGAFKVVIIGALAAGAAFMMAKLINGK